ncbi:MAG: TolC family protein [Thermodesulfobacteriota bacterium]
MRIRKNKILIGIDLFEMITGVILSILLTSYQVLANEAITPPKNRTLNISAAIELALSNNSDVRIARARIGQAEERLKEVRSAIYPTLTLRAGYERIEEIASGGLGQFIPSDINRGSGQIETRYLISLGGGRRASIKQAKEEVKAVTLEKRQVQTLLAHQVRTGYYSLLLAREATKIARESLEFVQLQMEQSEARLEAGVGLKTDVLTFSVRVSENRIRLQEADNASRLALTALSELLAVKIPEDVVITFPDLSIDPTEDISIDILIQQAVNNRPELIALEKHLAASGEAIRVDKAAIWPRVELFANYGFTKDSTLKLTGEDDEARIGVTMSMDIFDGGAKQAKVRQSIHRFTELEAKFDMSKLKISRLLEDVLNNISEARSRVKTSRETIQLSEENLELRTIRYEAGVGTILEVTEGEVQLSQARLTELKAKIDLLIARSKLKEVLGVVE